MEKRLSGWGWRRKLDEKGECKSSSCVLETEQVVREALLHSPELVLTKQTHVPVSAHTWAEQPRSGWTGHQSGPRALPGFPLSDDTRHLGAPETQTQPLWYPFAESQSSWGRPRLLSLSSLQGATGHVRSSWLPQTTVSTAARVCPFQIHFSELGNFTAPAGQSHFRTDSKRGFWARCR